MGTKGLKFPQQNEISAPIKKSVLSRNLHKFIIMAEQPYFVETINESDRLIHRKIDCALQPISYEETSFTNYTAKATILSQEVSNRMQMLDGTFKRGENYLGSATNQGPKEGPFRVGHGGKGAHEGEGGDGA